jgi:hypothetical protein
MDSPELGTAQPFIERLERMRHRARRLLFLHGVFVLLAGALGVWVVLCLLDYVFWFPEAFRVTASLAWIALVMVVIMRRIAPAVVARFILLDVATKIEQRFPEFQDRLTSSVSFLEGARDTDDVLQRKLIERTEQIAAELPLEEAISTRPALRMLGIALLPMIVLASTAVMSPGWLKTGFSRFAMPWGAVEWPRRVHINPLITDVTVAKGQSVVLAMEVTAGAEASLRGTLIVRQPGQRTERLIMHREGAARYAATLGSVTHTTTFWFEAGDDDTRDQPGTVRVVERPVVENLRMTVFPPPYAHGTPRTIPFGQNAVDVVAGGRVDLSFDSSKPLGDLPRAQVGSADRPPVEASYAAESTTLSASVFPEESRTYAIEIIDHDGFANEPPQTFVVDVSLDHPPEVNVRSPNGVVETTPQGRVRIRATITDDLGVSSVGVRVQGDGLEERTIRFDGWRSDIDARGHIVVELEEQWDLNELGVAVGQTLEFVLEGEDNRRTAELAPQVGQSFKMTIKIISPAQLAAHVADELHRLSGRLVGFQTRQALLIRRAAELYDDLVEDPQRPGERDLLRLSNDQRHLTRELAVLRKAAIQLHEKLDDNGIHDTQEVHQATMIAERLRDLVEPVLQQAAAQFNEARGVNTSAAQVALTAEATSLQRTGAQEIARLIDELAVWDDFNSVLAHVRELIDVQQGISQQTAVLQVDTLGRKAEDLEREIRERIGHAANGQDRITAAMQRAVSRMEELEKRVRSERPQEARSLAEARRSITRKQLRELSESAATAIRQNRTGEAQIKQNDIERQLVEAATALETSRSRQLDELSKRLALAEEAIQALLDDQSKLQAEVRAASTSNIALAEFGGPQKKMVHRAEAAANEVHRATEDGEATRLTRLAGAHMNDASEQLYGNRGDDADAAQTHAIEKLQRAFTLLKTRREQTERQQRSQALLAVKRTLKVVRRKQHGINDETTALVHAADQAGRMNRRLTRKAKRQGAVQQERLTEIETLVTELESTPVYAWVLNRIAEAMTRSRDHLLTSKLDANLTRAQTRTITLLDQLIEALEEAETLAEQQFAESGGGSGGSAGKPGKQVAVPRVAELLVLKGLQQDIRERTVQLATDIGDQPATEADLERITALAQDQAQLRGLTTDLTQAARQAGAQSR